MTPCQTQCHFKRSAERPFGRQRVFPLAFGVADRLLQLVSLMADVPDLPQLPLPLIQLIHLHLLEYPLANNPEYDQSLFDPAVRGLKDRTKSMEDVCFFLVGKVEGRREAAKGVSIYTTPRFFSACW